jgi:glycosyltransferase involved in cell wall biosynthesis
MQVSVIIATYNRAHSIGHAIRSILNQTHQEIELIVVDDGSTDETLSILQTFSDQDSRLKIIPLSQNSGATVARNRGVSAATGDLVLVWDSDDQLFPNALTKVVSMFSSNSNLGIVSAECRQRRGQQIEPHASLTTGIVELTAILCRSLPSCAKVRVVRRELMQQVRYEARNLDFMVNCYLASLGTWYHLSEELGELQLESDAVSLTRVRRIPNEARSIARIEPLERFMKQFGALQRAHCPGRHAALCYGLAIALLLDGKQECARQYARMAFHHVAIPRFMAIYLLTCIPRSPFIMRSLFRLGAWWYRVRG